MKRGLSNRDRVLAIPYTTERKGDLYVRVPYKDPSTGKWRSKEKKLAADATPEDAINLIAGIKNKLEINPAAFDGDRMLFDELLGQWLRAHPKAPKWYTEPLAFFNGRKIRSITYADVKRFREAREQVKRLIKNPSNRKEKIEHDRKPATINREVEILRGVLLFGVRHGWLERNPMVAGPSLIIKSEEDRRDRIPTPEEEARLLAVCVPPREHLRGLIMAALDTGLRRGALLSLTWPTVDWEKRLLKVPSGNRYKRRPKLIGLTDRLYCELRRIWESRECPTEGKIFNVVADFKRSYKTACRLAGVVGLQFRDLRHGFATSLMEANIPERLAMKVTGHTNPETHGIYTNVDERLARQVADALTKLHADRNAGGNDYPLATELPQ